MQPIQISFTVLFILFWIVSGLLAMDLCEKKGRDSRILWFFLGYIGLIYCAGLPDNRPLAPVKKGDKTFFVPADVDFDASVEASEARPSEET